MVKPIAERGMVLPFEPLSISFDDICYYVDLPAVSQPINPFTSCIYIVYGLHLIGLHHTGRW